MQPTIQSTLPENKDATGILHRPSFTAEIWFDSQYKITEVNALASQWLQLTTSNKITLNDKSLDSLGIHLKDRQFRTISVNRLLENLHNEPFIGLVLPKETRWVRWEVKRSETSSVLFLADVSDLMTDLFKLEQKAEDVNTLDILTRLYNRRYAMERLAQMHLHAKRYRSSFTLAVVDIDHFKRINDTFGHIFGDEVIQRIAGVIRNGFRETDLCARIGGEEFLILMPETESNEAVYSIDRLRQQVSELKWPQMQRPVTVSCGVVSWNSNKSIEQLLFVADQRLSTAKKAGRNQVCGDLV